MKKQKPTQHDITVAAFEALIAKHGERISPRALLDEARDFNSPFHDFFAWNDDEAAEQYRLIQAGQLLRRWKGSVMRIDSAAKLVSVQSVRRVQSPQGQRTRGGASYEAIESIMADPTKRADMVATVLRELSAYRKRYAQIEALSEVWRAIDDATEAHAPSTTAAGIHEQPNAAP